MTVSSVTALDHANVEDALLPIPMIFVLVDGKIGAKPMASKDDVNEVGVDTITFCMEYTLRSLWVLPDNNDLTFNPVHDARILKDISLEASILRKKFRLLEPTAQLLDSLYKLSGRLQLIPAQIDKAADSKSQTLTHDLQIDGSESEDDDVDEVLYGVEDENSQHSSDSDD